MTSGKAEPDAPSTLAEQAAAAVAAMAELCQTAARECGGQPDDASLAEVELGWSPSVSAADLAEQARSTVRAALAEHAVVRPGHVYCYHCESSDCEHSAPPTAGQVFGGYENTGRPRWQELFNCLLEFEDERVDQLFDERPVVLARLVGRKSLITEQFVAYGRDSLTYRVVGQVVAGYLKVKRAQCAMTVQIVETAEHHLATQVIAPDILIEALTDADNRRASTLCRIHDGLRKLRRRVRRLDSEWKSQREKKQRQQNRAQVFTYLRHLAGSIERKDRQSRRRSDHAQQRSQEQRPVPQANADLAAAGADSFFRDRKTQGIIVLGKKGRSHVFSQEGKHITSLAMGGDQLQRRVQRRRFVPLEAKRIAAFKAAVAGQ